MPSVIAREQVLPLPGGLWEVQLLGGLRARNGDVVVNRFGGRPAALLFSRLLLESGQDHSRDHLAEWLWPSDSKLLALGVSDQSRVRRDRLKRTLFDLNAALTVAGQQAIAPIIADRYTLRLNEALFECDAIEFERQVRAGQRAAALRLYRGTLLPGFNDPWVDEQRARFESLLEDMDLRRPEPDLGVALRPAASALLAYTTTFFGRQSETARLIAAIAKHRLVVITGVGGCGKTRLSAHLARQVPEVDRRVFVALENCSQPAMLFDHLRVALRLPPDDSMPRRPPLAGNPGGRTAARVVVALTGNRTLLVLDNFEQLVSPESEAALTWLLDQLPGLRLLVTSRRALRLPSASLFPLKPLPVPELACGLDAVARSPSVALFVDRARAVNAQFTINRRNHGAVADLVRALDGLPLAIEIAASRVRDMRPREIGLTLRRDLAMLARKGARPRKNGPHASLDAVLEQSWRMLGAREREALMCLTAFRGGWTAQQAQAVVDGEVKPLLNALMRDSLVSVEAEDTHVIRFQMLNVVREFAAERMPGELAVSARLRHRNVFASLAATSLGERQPVPVADLPNLLAAVTSALDDGLAEDAAAISSALDPLTAAAGGTVETLDLLRRTAAELPLSSERWPHLAGMLTRLLVAAGLVDESRALVSRALSAAADDGPRLTEALLSDASVRWLVDRDADATRARAENALHLAVRHKLPNQQARAQLLIGAALLTGSEHAAKAMLHFEKARRLFRQLDDRRGELRALSGRSACLLVQSAYRAAIKASTLGEQLAVNLGDIDAQLQFCTRLSNSWAALGEHARAVAVCRRSVRLSHAHGLAYQQAYAIWNLCEPLARLGQLELAAQLMAFSAQYWVSRFSALDPSDQEHADLVRTLVAEGLGARRCTEQWALGLAITEARAVELACQ